MDKNDKTYLWMTIAAFVAFAVAFGFAFKSYTELTDPVVTGSGQLF